MPLRNQRLFGLALVFGLSALALQALWRLLTGPDRIGIEGSDCPFFAMVALSWGALYAVYRLPRADQESVIAPGEWRAWITLLVISQLVINLLLNAWRSDGASLLEGLYRGSVIGNTILLIFAWMVVYSAIDKRWRGQVQEDERDREIDRIAAGWGMGAFALCIIGIAVMLGMSPPEKLLWAKPPVIANLLIFALLWGRIHPMRGQRHSVPARPPMSTPA